MGWIALGMVTAIVTMLLKCRIPHSRVTLEKIHEGCFPKKN